MTRLLPLAFLLAVASGGLRPPLAASGDDKKSAPGFVPLFNGKDLSGWVNVNCATGTFFVKGDEIVTTGEPTGFLRTDKQYENFELEFEWMHTRKEGMANSGLFVWGDPLPAVGTPYTRGIEVQVLINYKSDWATSHGDIFSIWGAKCVPDRPHPKGIERCLPSEDRVKGAGEWNHYRVVANDGVIKLSVNGKEVSGVSKCNPRKGYLALESEGAECHFRNLKLKELPSTDPKPDEVAKVWEGHKSLFTGLDLTGWTIETRRGDALPESTDWRVSGGQIRYAGPGDNRLATGKKYKRYEFFYDLKLSADKITTSFVAPPGPASVAFARDGKVPVITSGKSWPVLEVFPIAQEEQPKPGAWMRAGIRYDGKELTTTLNGHRIFRGVPPEELPVGPIKLSPREGLEIMNVFVRELK